jgi:hypothetical protein
MTTPKKSKTTEIHTVEEGATTMKTSTKSKATNVHHAAAAETEATSASDAVKGGDALVAATPATPATSPSVASVLTWIQQCTAMLEQVAAAMPSDDALTATDRIRMPKSRKGAERYIPQLVALAQQYGVSLALVPLDAIASDAAEAAALVPLQKQIEQLNTRISNRMFSVQSTSWSGSSKLYAVLRRLSKDNGNLATGLAPIAEFFSYRHPSVAENHPKTAKGKEALAAKKAAAAPAASVPVAPEAAPVATPPVSTPAPAVEATASAAPVTTHP